MDDNTDIAELISDWLTAHGYIVAQAYTGADALELLKAQAFETVLMDIELPDMTGVEVIRQAANVGALNSSCVIFCSGNCTLDIVPPDIRAQFPAFLPKPFQFAELIPAIERARAAARA